MLVFMDEQAQGIYLTGIIRGEVYYIKPDCASQSDLKLCRRPIKCNYWLTEINPVVHTASIM